MRSRKRRSGQFHFGVLIFGAILFYLIASLFLYFTSDPITAYEVKTGSLTRTSSYTGLILRDELVVRSSADGRVSYFQPEASKVKVGSHICLINTDSLEEVTTISAQESAALQEEIDSGRLLQPVIDFQSGFKADRFEDTYSFHQQLNSLLIDAVNSSHVAQIEELTSAEANSSYIMENTPLDGIVAYHIDGYEDLTPETLSASSFDFSGYSNTDLRKEKTTRNGDALYKVVRSEFWNLCILLDDATNEYLRENQPSEVQVQIHKDNTQLWGDLTLTEIDGKPACIISFDQAMVRYASDRYLDVSLNLQNRSGLKIPISAVTEKPFYLVPQDYLTKGGGTGSDGVLIITTDDEGSNVVFQNVEVYKVDREAGVVYLDSNVLQQGQMLQKPDSAETFTISESAKLRGVYNINKGYAVFKQIEVLAENSEYCIVKEGTSYGIANFDHIALDSSSVKEDDIVH